MTSLKTIAGSYFTRINLKVSCFDIDRHNLAMIAFLDLRAHLRFSAVRDTRALCTFTKERFTPCLPSQASACVSSCLGEVQALD